ncbi:MAG: hypothetical protein ING75_06245 [Rhodocyclaceae bacterium]|nr:hypothetical protein [Rhodocyclaceae bacterium]
MRVSKNQVTLLAAAVASLFAASANAQVNLNSAGGVTGNYTPGKAILFASELTITPTTGTALTGPANAFNIGSITGAASPFTANTLGTTQAGLDALTGVPLGVGIDGGQKRFIRLDLSGGARFGTGLGNARNQVNIAATLSTGAGGKGGTIAGDGTGTGQFAGVTIALGGVGSSFVVYEVTAGSAGNVQNDILQILVPQINITSNANAVNLTYGVYEFLTGASAATSPVFTRSTPLIAMSRATRFGVAQSGGATALAANGFRDFGTGVLSANLGVVGLGRAADLGTTIYTAAQPVDAAGASITQVSTVVNTGVAGSYALTGDFSAAAGPASVYTLSRHSTASNTSCAINAASGANLLDSATAVTASGATIPLSTANWNSLLNTSTAADFSGVASGHRFCYTVNGTTALGSPVQSYSVVLSATANANYTLPTFSASLGSITRDGVDLIAPWASATPGWISRFVLTDLRTPAAGQVATPWTAVVRNANGVVTGTGAVLSGTVAPGTVSTVTMDSLLGTTTATGPFQVTFTVGGSGTPALAGTYVLTAPNGTSNMSMPFYRQANR